MKQVKIDGITLQAADAQMIARPAIQDGERPCPERGELSTPAVGQCDYLLPRSGAHSAAVRDGKLSGQSCCQLPAQARSQRRSVEGNCPPAAG
jgi:hypothetical protein